MISCEITETPPKQMVRAVDTRWNSLAEAIHRAIELKPALERLVWLAKYDKPGKAGLRRYKLTSEEWCLLEQLWPLLNVRRSLDVM